MSLRITALLSVAVLLCCQSLGFAAEPAASGNIDPQARASLTAMSAYLAQLPQFTVTAHKLVDYTLDSGQKIQLAHTTRAAVQRPNRIRAATVGDSSRERLWYKGDQLTILDDAENAYSVIDVPDTIDAMMDFLVAEYGVAMPLADVILSKPYEGALEKVRSGQYLGLHFVMDVQCHHLAFRQAGIDWQVWIDAGPYPLPRKIVITDKELPGHPQFIAFLSDWNTAPELSDDYFDVQVPESARKVAPEVLQATQDESPVDP